jgi:predicted Zn-dependent protease
MLRLVADTRLSQQQYPSAFFLYREALNRAPEMRGLHAAVAEIYRRTDRAEWAEAETKQEAALGSPDCAAASPECDFLAGKLDAVTNAKGDAPEARYWRARAYAALAVKAFSSLETLPASPAKHDITAQLLAQQKRHADAAAEWKKALALAPGEPGFEAAYAMQLFLAGDIVEARPLLEKQLAAAPGDAQWNFFLGDILLREQDPEKAASLLKKAVAADPQLLPAHHALGRALMALDLPEEAIPHLKAALDTDQDGSLHYQLAQAFIRTGRRDEARAPLAKSQELRQAAEARQSDAQSMEITAP